MKNQIPVLFFNSSFILVCSIWSLEIPAIHVNFVGMSLYFFVVDFIRSIYKLGNTIQPTVEELKSYGRRFCAMKWEYFRVSNELRN